MSASVEMTTGTGSGTGSGTGTGPEPAGPPAEPPAGPAKRWWWQRNKQQATPQTPTQTGPTKRRWWPWIKQSATPQTPTQTGPGPEPETGPETGPVTEPGSGVKKETTFDKLGRKWNSNSTKQKWVLGIFFVLLFFAIIVALCYWASKICSGDASTQGVLCKLANDVTGAASDILLYPYIFIGILLLGMLMKAFAFIRNNAKDKLTKNQTTEEKEEADKQRIDDPSVQDWLEGKAVKGVVTIPIELGTYIKKGLANLATGKKFNDENNYDPSKGGGSGSDPEHPGGDVE